MSETVYFVVPKTKLTQRMVNVSTSAGDRSKLAVFKDAYIVEVYPELRECLLDYPMFTEDAMRDQLDNTDEEKQSWWQKLLSLFPI